jgi:hypothetical protein
MSNLRRLTSRVENYWKRIRVQKPNQDSKKTHYQSQIRVRANYQNLRNCNMTNNLLKKSVCDINNI